MGPYGKIAGLNLFNYSKLFITLSCRLSAKQYCGQRQIPSLSRCCNFVTNKLTIPINSGQDVRFCNTTEVSSSLEEIPADLEYFLQNAQDLSSLQLSDLVLSSCKENAKKLSEKQILDLIASLNRIPVNDTSESLLFQLENVCIDRARHWDIETFLNFFKQYSQVGFIKNSKFPVYALKSRSKYIFNRCSLPVILDFLQLVNDANIGRRIRFNNKCDAEHVLNKHLNDIRPDQVSLFIDLLSSTGESLRNARLKENLCKWFVCEAATLSEDIVRKFILLFSGHDSSNPLFLTPLLVQILKAIEERLDEFDLKCLSVIASTYSRTMIFDENVLEKIAAKLLNSLKVADVRCIESIVGALASFNYHSKTRDLYNEIVQQMRKEPIYDRLRSEPRVLCRILMHLSFVDVYPYDLLNLNFSKECLKCGYKRLCKYNVPYEVRMLIGGLKIERPDYKSCKINFNIIRYDARKHKLSFPKILRESTLVKIDEKIDSNLNAPKSLSPYNRTLYSVRILLNHIFGSFEYTHVCYVFHHSSRANILFCTNQAKQLQKLPSSVLSNVLLKYKELDTCNLNYYVIVFQSKNIYMDYEPFFKGEDIAKTRQIRNLGFKTITLLQHGWLKFSLQEKKKMLQNLLLKEGILL